MKTLFKFSFEPISNSSYTSLPAVKKVEIFARKHLKITLFILILASFSGFSQGAKKLVWEENFDGYALNTTNWNYTTGDGCPDLCGFGNNERQIYEEENITVKDGNLVIAAVKVGDAYYSGKIDTKDKREFKYGTFEVRAKVPGGQGIWPAIWMLGTTIDEKGWPSCGEIDIMEFVGRQPDTVHTTLHSPANHGATASTQVTPVKNITEAYHVFKIDWDESAITFSIDGKKVFIYAPKEKNDNNYPFRHPFYFLLNMAVGGNFGGPEVDDSIFPRTFYIDYIKVYQ